MGDQLEFDNNQIEFDIFLAHNSEDKPQIKEISEKLKRRNLRPWMDEEILAGDSFQKVIQNVIPSVKSAAIFIGANGLGNWQEEEVQLLLDRCKQEKKPLFLILLPGVIKIPQELGFLQQRHWVSFEKGANHALNEIESGIRRKKVKPFFDVLLCYREDDLPEIIKIESQLKVAEISLWKTGLNASSLKASVLNQLDEELERIWSIAVFIGSNGGPWDQEIIADLIIDFREGHRPVIPIILKSVPLEENLHLPVYLRRLGKVDFRQEEPDPMKRMLLGITDEEKYQ